MTTPSNLPPEPTTTPTTDPGPTLCVSVVPMLGAMVGATVAIALLGGVVVGILRGRWEALAESSALAPARGAAVVLTVSVLCTVCWSPWVPRSAGRWVVLWLSTRAACVVLTVAVAGLLLYSAPPQDRAALGVSVAAAYLAVLGAETAAVGRCLRRGRRSTGRA